MLNLNLDYYCYSRKWEEAFLGQPKTQESKIYQELTKLETVFDILVEFQKKQGFRIISPTTLSPETA